MEHRSDLGRPSACHDPDFGERLTGNADPAQVREATYALTGGSPRLFALIQEFGEEGEEVDAVVVAYGMALPGGTVTTVGANGRGFGLWTSARSAARRLHSDLVWFGDGGVRESTP
ncbi:hypothetical protein ABT061_30265 [Streptosporangium sp. NPDC002544]|uniref:hypothetical protein n=1 Tax=Streptosporangium sp. NPDC002544 TaxID=3154538 RepID=UPI00332E96A1